jgi:hypothetical protein
MKRVIFDEIDDSVLDIENLFGGDEYYIGGEIGGVKHMFMPSISSQLIGFTFTDKDGRFCGDVFGINPRESIQLAHDYGYVIYAFDTPLQLVNWFLKKDNR